MKAETLLEQLNQHPLAGALLIALLLSVGQIIRLWKGKNDATLIEHENNRLAKQTSETVNKCAAHTQAVMDSIDRLLEAGDFGSIRADLERTVSVLEAMVKSADLHDAALVRVDNLCRDILGTLERNDSRVVHSDIIAKIQHMQSVIDDIKRISIDIGNNNLRGKL